MQEQVQEGRQTDIQVRLPLLLNFAKTQPRRLKAWVPSRTVYTGAHLLFSPARWLPVCGCDTRVAVGICHLGELTLTREKQLCLVSLTQLATH